MSKPEGAGSVWNVNSWHWELKNYTEIVKQIITKKIENMTLQKDTLTVILDKVSKIKGEAQVNIRKGKQIICYEFDVEVDWSAENEKDTAEGTFHIQDINESDLDFEIQDIKAKEKTQISDPAKDLIRKQVRGKLEEQFKTLTQEITQIEADRDKLEADKKHREEMQRLMAEAQAKTGAEKEKIFEEMKQKELKMKEELSKVK
mmetsp:Transcript_12878/g.11006  ORF Transcript_12878/g.11006 Transcript_12878/m.11006 type:complete len:203 (-) Transcript_12878:193-801(-)|eukprot:CAMPEP_0114587832 /NCGR_PEP_ID=MMETSP0125-20121206/10694_1 /TAXON_ID=485358 ORGANISM="Aristerostoma sp., Strain ATCC 50986" /NCGR_SAMPLE_ID=MMETSP0125 /ASSEMBLY_ACC=CAM_ASM_000245 /LENGTH=202 /DNA_ID=CAMNT_0001783941 /DNA_START=59 /DNA_END=667 /DNA_ORIENTATION=+